MLATIMNQFFGMFSNLSHAAGDWVVNLAPFLATFAIQTALWVLPGVILLLAAKLFIMVPMRRHEAARAFLDLLEMGLAQGRSLENTVVEIAATGDKTLGKEFRRLAERIRNGASLGSALKSTPGVLPEPVVAMLQARRAVGRYPQGSAHMSRCLNLRFVTCAGSIQLSPRLFPMASIAGNSSVHRDSPLAQIH